MTLRKISSIIAVTLITLYSSFIYADAVEDTAITAEVKAKLLKEPDIPATKIEVTTNDAIVTLKGTIDTRLQANRAIEIASSVDKVVDVVDDNLRVKQSNAFVSDGIITAKAKGKIAYLALYNKVDKNNELHVETTNGVVHINGYVNKAADVDEVIDTVKAIKGVKSVKNGIKVKE